MVLFFILFLNFIRIKINREIFYKHIYLPPTVIDSVWSCLILSSRIYEEYCNELCGLYIERINYNINTVEVCQEISLCVSTIEIINESFKMYVPIWNHIYFPAGDPILKYDITLQKSMLDSVISKINLVMSCFNPQANITSSIIEECTKFYNELCFNHDKLFSDDEREEIVDSLNHDKIKMPCELLKSFAQRYCISEDDVLLIIIEYYKFLTIVKIKGDGFTPSPWVDEFWHHHMSSDTYHYRNFCISLFGSKIDHFEYDHPNVLNSERLNNAREEVNKTHQAYKEVFGYSPPQSIWPDMSSGDVSLYPTFIRINLFNTFCCKFLVMTCNKNLNDESISTPDLLTNSYADVPESKLMSSTPEWLLKYYDPPLFNHSIIHPQSLIYMNECNINEETYEQYAEYIKEQRLYSFRDGEKVQFIEDLVEIHQKIY